MSKRYEYAIVESQECLADGIYSLILKTQAAAEAKAGQFISLYSKDGSHLMPRPISICQINKIENKLRLVYRVAGFGTDEFSKLTAGDEIKIMGPLGNGFPLEGKNPCVVGGGIGVPPMLGLSESLQKMGASVSSIMGYRNSENFLKEELTKSSKLYVATDDGSVGTHGTVVDAIKEQNVTCDVMYACGPKPMLKALSAYCLENDIKLYISLEERMACGVGACLGCVCKTKEVDDHSQVNNKRICKDGPVFLSTEVEL